MTRTRCSISKFKDVWSSQSAVPSRRSKVILVFWRVGRRSPKSASAAFVAAMEQLSCCRRKISLKFHAKRGSTELNHGEAALCFYEHERSIGEAVGRSLGVGCGNCFDLLFDSLFEAGSRRVAIANAKRLFTGGKSGHVLGCDSPLFRFRCFCRCLRVGWSVSVA